MAKKTTHANCLHVSTPAARKMCRALGLTAPSPVVDTYVADDMRRQLANYKVKAVMDRRYDADGV